jgi:hypothetical protein
VIAEVLDSLDGLFRIVTRTPTLDGSVPLRVARACLPLLEGNAYGLQLVLARPLLVTRRLGRWRASWADGGEAMERQHAGTWPRLREEGFLPRDSAWLRALDGPLVQARPGGLRVFTGLLVRPEPGVWMRLTSTANRRNTLFEVKEQLVADDGAWVPIVLDLAVRADAPASFRLEGELACLGALRPGVRVTSVAIADAPELARAHAAFYDRAYFEEKKEEVTGKYRRVVAGEAAVPAESTAAAASCRVASLGPRGHDVEALDRFTTAAGPEPEARPRDERRLETIVFRNALAFSGLFDGHTLSLDYDRARLEESASAVRASFRSAMGTNAGLDHPGSELYLTKYFTPHPPGEPHFFVKPWALTATPPGWASLVEGRHGDGYDVMRGIVSTDVFHATPAVFHVHAQGTRFEVAEGAPLLRVIPVPRALLTHEFRLRTLA